MTLEVVFVVAKNRIETEIRDNTKMASNNLSSFELQ